MIAETNAHRPVHGLSSLVDDLMREAAQSLPANSFAMHDMSSVIAQAMNSVAAAAAAPVAHAHAPSAETASVAVGYDASTAAGQWNVPVVFGAHASALLAANNGAGVHVGDYDSGIDKSVAALMTHYDASREVVVNGVRADPGILSGDGDGVHGTATAGIISADASKDGGQVTGMAYGASLTSVNIFSGAASGAGELSAIKQMTNFDVTNNSWGWSNKWSDGAGTPNTFASVLRSDIKYVADTGRAGLGTVIVKSAGNDWLTDHRDANTQEMNADRHVVTVGAIGQNGDVASYSQRGADVLVSGPSNGGGWAGISTTDVSGAAGYASGSVTNDFGGTSASAPEVTAVVADMMGANSHLGWRDVQSILALTAVDSEPGAFRTGKVGNMAYGFAVNHAAGVNGGGYHFSNDVGFGELNGHDAIREASVWNYFSPVAQSSANEAHAGASTGLHAVSATSGATFAFNVTQSISIENVDLTLNVSTANLDHMKVTLTGPTGTQSIMLDTSTTLQGETGQSVSNYSWTLGSHAYMGELSKGTWTVAVTDATASDHLTVNSGTLDVYGAAPSSSGVFHYTDEALKMEASSQSRLTVHDARSGNWMDTAATTGNESINLNSGAVSTVNGKAFAVIGNDGRIDNVTLGDGVSKVVANNHGDKVVGGWGFDTMIGGTGNDTFVAGHAGASMTGGAGNDTFSFNHDGFGTTTINDFSFAGDRINLSGLNDTFAKLSIVDTGSKVTISNVDAAGDSIVLANTHGQHVSAAHFAFA